ncbi:hypothetical protein LXL04_026855 [Taraxacum kok-saghyz]
MKPILEEQQSSWFTRSLRSEFKVKMLQYILCVICAGVILNGRFLLKIIVTDHKDSRLLRACAREANYHHLQILINDFSIPSQTVQIKVYEREAFQMQEQAREIRGKKRSYQDRVKDLEDELQNAKMAEYRISIYGRKQSECDNLASWTVNCTNPLYIATNVSN